MAKTSKKQEAASNEMKNTTIARRALVQPLITEKSHAVSTNGAYVFKVAKQANKTEVKKAIEGIYGVNVSKVAIVNLPAKRKNYGRHARLVAPIKKAIVTLKKGQAIELFRGA